MAISGQDRNPGPRYNALHFSIDPKRFFNCQSYRQPHTTHHFSIPTMPPSGPGPDLVSKMGVDYLLQIWQQQFSDRSQDGFLQDNVFDLKRLKLPYLCKKPNVNNCHSLNIIDIILLYVNKRIPYICKAIQKHQLLSFTNVIFKTYIQLLLFCRAMLKHPKDKDIEIWFDRKCFLTVNFL